MFDFFSQVLGYIEVLWNWVLSFFALLGDFIAMITLAIQAPVFMVGMVHPILGSAILIFLALFVVKTIFGR